jgi:RimJ/RimL family protein N-acetyltransferase
VGIVSNAPRSTMNQTSEVGYWLRSDATGRGLMTAAVRLVLHWGFAEQGYRRSVIQAAASNDPSRRVAERVGAVHEGLQRQAQIVNGHVHDLHLYSVLADEFDNRGPIPTPLEQ